jgi:hypothetical protein
VIRTGERGSPVTVSVAYDVLVSGILSGWLLPATVTLDDEATARQEFG